MQLALEEGLEFHDDSVNIKWLPLFYFDDVLQETLFIDD